MSETSQVPTRRSGAVQLGLAVLGTAVLVGFVGHPELSTSRGLAMAAAGASVVAFLVWNGIRGVRGRAED